MTLPPPTPIVCPACGSDELEPLVGDGYCCVSCAHVFRVVNGRALDFDNGEDDDSDDAA